MYNNNVKCEAYAYVAPKPELFSAGKYQTMQKL